MYLGSIYIRNFRGIKELSISFDKKLNVIIGANGQLKTTLIDAIRLFYSWGTGNRDIEVTKDDFYVNKKESSDGGISYSVANEIEIVYTFEGLSDNQKAAFYQYLVCESEEHVYAKVSLKFNLLDNGKIRQSFVTGKPENGLKADWETLQYFVSYYLGALRDSTKDLLSTRNNLLGKVIKRRIDKASTEDRIKEIINRANKELLGRKEVQNTKQGINDNLQNISNEPLNVSLHIEQSRIEYIVNVIKPYLPFSLESEEGFMLSQNSLGINNLIYIATVLSDIKECHEDDPISVCALFIEEPEAHLHPQLQINLHNFLKEADSNVNSQTFMTTHSPTLASRIPLENLILLQKGGKAITIGDCFKDRESEGIVKDMKANKQLNLEDVVGYRRMLARYLDVTRSQIFFSKGCAFIEGISECQLLETFSKLLKKSLLDNQIEIVNTGGVAFYQFLMLFNSSYETKRLSQKVSVITDEDQFTDSKDSMYNIECLVANNYQLLDKLRDGINKGRPNGRIDNLRAMSNGQSDILIASGVKTLEYQICLANTFNNKESISKSWLYEFLKLLNNEKVALVDNYLNQLGPSNFGDNQKQNVAILLWKCIPSKAAFAQELNSFLLDKMENNVDVAFKIPPYIENAINHLVQ